MAQKKSTQTTATNAELSVLLKFPIHRTLKATHRIEGVSLDSPVTSVANPTTWRQERNGWVSHLSV